MRTAAKARKVRLGRLLRRPMFPPSPVTCWTIRGSRRRGLERERRANAGRTAATSPPSRVPARARRRSGAPLGRTPAPPPGPRPRSSGTPAVVPPRRSERGPRQCRLASSAFERVVDVHPHRPFPPPRPPTPRRTGRRSVSRLWSARRSFAQRKAAERASQLSSAEPVRGLESDPLPPLGRTTPPRTRRGGKSTAARPPRRATPRTALSRAATGERGGASYRATARTGTPRARASEEGESRPVHAQPGVGIPRSPPAGRLMPWEQQMLIERAEREAAARPPPDAVQGGHPRAPSARKNRTKAAIRMSGRRRRRPRVQRQEQQTPLPPPP